MSWLDTDRQKPEILAVRTAAKTAIFEVQSVDLRFANGCERTYERLAPARRPAVMVLPVQDGALVMIREYAVGTERYELTCVKGLIDGGETPEQAALRELQEEIGHTAAALSPLRVLYSSPSHMYGPMHVFVGVPLSRLDELIADAAFGDARTLSALMLFQRTRSAKAA